MNISETTQAPNESEENPLIRSPGLRVLIIEDDLCLKSAVTRVLSTLDNKISIQWVTTGKEALEHLQSDSIDFVISDYLLPDFENGLGIWEKCKKLNPTMPFLLMSGIPVNAFLELTMGRKICPSFLPKPFWPDELRDTVSSMMTEALKRRRSQP